MCMCVVLSNICISLLVVLLYYVKSYGPQQRLASQVARQLAGDQTSPATYISEKFLLLSCFRKGK